MDAGVEDIIGIPADKIKPSDWTPLSDMSVMIGQAAGMKTADAILKYHSGDLPCWGQEYRVQSVGREVRWIRDYSILMRDEKGEITGSFGSIHDITELRKAQQHLLEAQKMESLGRMAGGVAHDFNNLLTVILGYAEMLMNDALPGSPASRYAKNIQKAGFRSSELISQLLAFARRQVLSPEAFSLNETLEETEALLGQLLPDNITLITRAFPDLWNIYADPGQCQQVLLNLAINARDAMQDGGNLTISTENKGIGTPNEYKIPEGEYVLLTVQDTGSGINEATQSHIFDPFFTTKPPGEGTGLGLSTSHGIVKQSGGFLFFKSKVGEGTTFQILFNRSFSEPISESDLPEECADKPIVLLVEDDDMIRDIAARVIQLEGYRVLVARDGKEALRLFHGETSSPVLLLTDVQMPGMTGIELVHYLLKECPDLPILFMTGYTDHALPAGCATLLKPFTSYQLRKKIIEMLTK